MGKLFKKVMVADRLPKEDGTYISCSRVGHVAVRTFIKKHNSFCHEDWNGDLCKTKGVEWYLEEIELPSEEVVEKLSSSYITPIAVKAYKRGVNMILNFIKNGEI